MKYKIKVFVQAQAELEGNKSYTTRVDQTLKEIQVNFTYNAEDYKNIQKLRYQINSLKKSKDYSLSA